MTAGGVALDRAFWRGFPALLLAFAVAQLLQQVDMATLARLGGGAPAAYVLLVRLALVDLVAVMALGAVTSVTVSQAARAGDPGPAIRRSLAVALAVGVALGLVGVAAYRAVAPWVAGGDDALAALVVTAVPWFAAAAPLRMVNGSAAFVLHAMNDGPAVVRWKLCEVVAKLGLNILFLEAFGAGFAGCFMASLLLQAGSAAWALARLRRLAGGGPSWPPWTWAMDFLRKAGWEAQRVLSTLLLGLVTVMLFASSLIGTADPARLDAFAAGSVLALLVFAPFVAFLRFLAMRFAGRPPAEIASLVRALLWRGVPVAAMLALLLNVGGDWLGASLYGQTGPWWSMLVAALAVSLPVRVAANTMRAALQATGEFAGVAKIDSLLGWCLGLPLIVLGLCWDAPAVAYGYLVVPEVFALLGLSLRLRGLAGKGGWQIMAASAK